MSGQRKPSLGNLLESFFRQRLIAQRKASPHTVASYRDALRLFLIFAAERQGKPPSGLALEDLDRDVVLAFLDHLEQERHNSISTRNARLAAIRSLLSPCRGFGSGGDRNRPACAQHPGKANHQTNARLPRPEGSGDDPRRA